MLRNYHRNSKRNNFWTLDTCLSSLKDNNPQSELNLSVCLSNLKVITLSIYISAPALLPTHLHQLKKRSTENWSSIMVSKDQIKYHDHEIFPHIYLSFLIIVSMLISLLRFRYLTKHAWKYHDTLSWQRLRFRVQD